LHRQYTFLKAGYLKAAQVENAGAFRRMPGDCCRAEKTMKTYAAAQKPAHFHGSIAASSDVAAI
jgi:hypothetical protein